MNSVRQPQSVLLLGGTSEIGLAIVRALPAQRLRHVTLAGRPSERLDAAVAALSAELPSVTVTAAAFDADDPASHRDALAAATSGADVDVVIVAFGVLGDQAAIDADPALALPLLRTNFLGGASAVLESASLLQRQGHGSIIVLSSVAGDRARASNYVYGASKAGLDTLSQGLGDALAGTGIEVLVVRPGFVHSRMTEGLEVAPFATTPEAVATDTVKAWRAGKHVVYSPAVLRAVMGTMKALPRPVFRKVAAK